MANEQRASCHGELERSRDGQEVRYRDHQRDHKRQDRYIIDHCVAVMRKLALVAVVLPFIASVARAQSAAPPDVLKRAPLSVTGRGTCPPAVTPHAPTNQQRRQARDLAERAQQAAILGDSLSARDQLRQAAQLDPTDPDLAYRLARASETSAAVDDAVAEYCRFLALSPSAPESAEAREKVASLARPTLSLQARSAEATFRAGIAAYERGQLVEAEAGFNAAITSQPTWADAYYDRALVLLKRGQRDPAARDFEQYLRLKPDADDRALVAARIDALRRATPSPGNALAMGLVIPGAGQFYTGRPLRGAVSFVAASAAWALALQQSTKTITVQQTATDPFGNPYTFTTTRLKTERPNLIPGIAAAGAITIGGAIEAFVFANNERRSGNRFSLSVVPTRDALVVRLSLSR